MEEILALVILVTIILAGIPTMLIVAVVILGEIFDNME